MHILRPRSKAGPQTPDQRRNRFLRELVETILLTALVYFIVRSSIQFTPIHGPSMQPGLHENQAVIVNELAYLFGSPQRGDVIVFHPPTDSGEQFIKRVIAVPGDTIELTESAIIVDGVTLHETYVNPLDTSPNENGGPLPKTTLRPGEYFVMGDNRGDSVDSRVFGPVTRQSIVGQAEFVTWPLGVVHWLPTYRDVFAQVKQ